MTVRYGREGRYFFILLLLCLFVAAQATAFASANEQHHSQDHCCLLCHVGPLPFLHTNTSAVATPVLSMVWLEAPPEFIATHDVLLSTCSSRAPPA